MLALHAALREKVKTLFFKENAKESAKTLNSTLQNTISDV
jgi:hypothetical protein